MLHWVPEGQVIDRPGTVLNLIDKTAERELLRNLVIA